MQPTQSNTHVKSPTRPFRAIRAEDFGLVRIEPGTDPRDPTLPPWPAPLGPRERVWLIGDIVDAIEPTTEADPNAILFQLLAALGNLLGGGPALEEDLQTLQARVDTLEASSRTTGMVATGSYAGDGKNGRIIETGLAGKLRAVQLWAKEDNANNSQLTITSKVDTMPGTECLNTWGLSLNGSTFVVDATFLLPGSDRALGSTLNLVDLTYTWVAVASPE